MRFYPSLEQSMLTKYDYTVVPVSCEIFADIRTPIEVLKTLRLLSARCFLLESAESGDRWARYSFLGFDPIAEVRLKNRRLTVNFGAEVTVDTDDPNEHLRSLLAQYRSPAYAALPPMTGGFVGYFSYDYGKYYGGHTPRHEADTPDMHLMLFDKIIAFDTYRQRMIFIANVRTDNLEENYRRAQRELTNLVDVVVHSRYAESPRSFPRSPVRIGVSQRGYCEKADRVKAHIREGDIFQAVISNVRTLDYEGSLLGAYRYLRTTNPSPYMFYMELGDVELAGASPETLVKKEGSVLTTFPIAGSMPRGRTAAEDEEIERALRTDPKELSEHDMLVDLGRNDLGKVCRFGSVSVKDYRYVKRFSHIMHITSTVTGEIEEGRDALDALTAALPAGTLSGAPKRRAMEIIDALEQSARGIYGGAVGYIDFAGNADFAIAIRMAVKRGGTVTVRSGGGIVADSAGSKEYAESACKAQAVIDALLNAGEEVL